jgi:hypothetical protein
MSYFGAIVNFIMKIRTIGNTLQGTRKGQCFIVAAMPMKNWLLSSYKLPNVSLPTFKNFMNER